MGFVWPLVKALLAIKPLLFPSLPAADDGTAIGAMQIHDKAMERQKYAVAQTYAVIAYDRAQIEPELADTDRAGIARRYGELLFWSEDFEHAEEVLTECIDFLGTDETDEVSAMERSLCHLRRAQVRLNLDVIEPGLADADAAIAEFGAMPQTGQVPHLLVEARLIRIPFAMSVQSQTRIPEDYDRVCAETIALLPDLVETFGYRSPQAMQIRWISGNCLSEQGAWGEAMDYLIVYYDHFKDDSRGWERIDELDQRLRQLSRQRVSSRNEGVVWYNWDGCGEIDLGEGPVRICIEKSWYPAIPDRAMETNTFGFADLSYDISSEGQIGNITVLRSWPDASYGKAAAWVMSGWRFKPPLDADGQPVAVTGLKEIFSFDPQDPGWQKPVIPNRDEGQDEEEQAEMAAEAEAG